MASVSPIARPKIFVEQAPLPKAWHGPDLVDDDFKIILSRDCMAELEAIVAEQRKAPVPTMVLLPEHFEMSACRTLMDDVKHRLDSGLGFVILDRLPVDPGASAEVIDMYWLLGSLLEPPVAQEWSGTMIYDVRYDGQGYTADTRAALTPEGLDMHNDSSMGEAPPTTSVSSVPADRAQRAAKARFPARTLPTTIF